MGGNWAPLDMAGLGGMGPRPPLVGGGPTPMGGPMGGPIGGPMGGPAGP